MPESAALPSAVVVGVGPGLGAALARRFAEGYAVAIVARHMDALAALAEEMRAAGKRVIAASADAASPEEVAAAFERIKQEIGAPEVLLYNVGNFVMGGVMEITPAQFERAWRVNAFGALLWSQHVLPAMLGRGRGAIIVTGATAGVKAGARSAAFGPAKFALRGLAQSMARDLGPLGVHVASVNIDGGIDTPGIRKLFPQVKDEDLLKPHAIAETYWHLAHQDRSAWTLETEVRPFKEKF